MENPNEQSQSYIINLLVRYGSLNSIYNEVFETKKLTVSQQQKIYNFYNDFNDFERFETELLCFFYLGSQTKNQDILNQLKSRIQSSVSLYDENLLFIDKVNVYEVCYRYVEGQYKERVKLMSDRIEECRKTRSELKRETELALEKSLSKDKDAGIRIELNRLEVLEKEMQEELDFTYRERNMERNEVLKYGKNVFKDIRELGLRFISISNKY
jgi:hypothetical protein